MKRNFFNLRCGRWFVAFWFTGLGGAARSASGVEAAPVETNSPAIALDALVADVVERNPELNFYRAEIASAKGERRSARRVL